MATQPLPDCTKEALLRLYSLQEPAGMACDGLQLIQRLCINPNCPENALICSDLECEDCKCEAHLMCSTVSLKAVTSLLNKRSARQKRFTLTLCELEDNFIKQLQGGRHELPSKHRFGSLEDRFVRIVEEIFEKNNSRCMKGREAKDLWKRLRKTTSDSSAQRSSNTLLDIYHKTLKSTMSHLEDLKRNLYQSFSTTKSLEELQELSLESRILQNPLCPGIQQFQHYNSIIARCSKSLVEELRSEQLDYLRTILGNPVKINLLYRASENDFRASAFHEKCDGLGNTLVLVRTEFGKTMGGFTNHPWSSSGGWVSDPHSNIFIFSLDLKEKWVPTATNNLIFGGSGHGPTFGGGKGKGHDMFISDNCNLERKSHAWFPETFNSEGEGRKWEKSQQTFNRFSGAGQSAAFRVLEYQVFQVCFQ